MDTTSEWDSEEWLDSAKGTVKWANNTSRNSRVMLLVRHSHREPITDHMAQLSTELTPLGCRMSEEMGRRLPFDRRINLFFSFVSRCVQTAQEIGKGLSERGATIEDMDALAVLATPEVKEDKFWDGLQPDGKNITEFVNNWADGVYEGLVEPFEDYEERFLRDVIERISAAPAGAMHIHTRRAGGFSGSLTAAGGNLGTSRFGGDIGFEAGRFDVLVTGSTGRTDGFRTNGDVDRDAITARAGFDVGSGRTLALTTVWSSIDAGTPGSLTPEELAEDPTRSPYNELDFLDSRDSMVTLAFEGSASRDLSLAANLHRRDATSESLTTGRVAAAFGQGFLANLDTTTVGAVAQVTHDRR